MALKSSIEVIDKLGGTAAVAELTGRKYNAVWMWRAFGKFPANTYLAIQSALKERGLEAPPELWGMTQSEDA
jgi:hypothetical protein